MVLTRKRKASKRLVQPPKKVKRTTTPKKQTSTDVADEKGEVSKGNQRSGKKSEGTSGMSDTDASSSANSSKANKYFPFRILDNSWTQIASDIPFLGLSKPSLHENTLSRLCSRGLTDVSVLPTADRQGFVKSEGHWRLMIAGLNRRAIINAIFLPEYSTRTEGGSGENGVFLTALATGAFPNKYRVETILNYASEELKGRRIVFVLDVYSHGEDKVEIVINRAY